MLIIQRSQIAGFSFSGTLAPGLDRPYIPFCAEHGAGVGRSSTERSYGAARKGRNGKSTGAVDETATGSANFFVLFLPCRTAASGSTTIGAMSQIPRPPSIDQGVVALIWAVGLGAYIYFGLIAVGESGAIAVVISMVSFAAIWLVVRLRGEEQPLRPRSKRRRTH
jgi:hypothetical protein